MAFESIYHCVWSSNWLQRKTKNSEKLLWQFSQVNFIFRCVWSKLLWLILFTIEGILLYNCNEWFFSYLIAVWPFIIFSNCIVLNPYDLNILKSLNQWSLSPVKQKLKVGYLSFVSILNIFTVVRFESAFSPYWIQNNKV